MAGSAARALIAGSAARAPEHPAAATVTGLGVVAYARRARRSCGRPCLPLPLHGQLAWRTARRPMPGPKENKRMAIGMTERRSTSGTRRCEQNRQIAHLVLPLVRHDVIEGAVVLLVVRRRDDHLARIMCVEAVDVIHILGVDLPLAIERAISRARCTWSQCTARIK